MGRAVIDRQVGIVGAGNVGGRMVRALVDAGQRVSVYDASPVALEAAARHGADARDSTADLAADADVVLLSLPNSDVVETVLVGEGGVLSTLRPDALVVDMSTSLPSRTLDLVERCAAAGVRMLDAPISFGRDGMDIMVGGPQGWYAQVKPIFDVVGPKSTWVGPHGHGHVTKLVQNMISGVGLAIVAEALAFGVKAGVDPMLMWEAIRTAGGASGAVDRIPEMVRHEFGEGGQMALHHKDMKYAVQTAEEIGALVPFSAQLVEVFGEALQHGDRRWGQRGCITYWERRMGITVGDAGDGDREP